MQVLKTFESWGVVLRYHHIVVPQFDSVQLVHISPITRTYGRYIELVDVGMNQLTSLGGTTLQGDFDMQTAI